MKNYTNQDVDKMMQEIDEEMGLEPEKEKLVDEIDLFLEEIDAEKTKEIIQEEKEEVNRNNDLQATQDQTEDSIEEPKDDEIKEETKEEVDNHFNTNDIIELEDSDLYINHIEYRFINERKFRDIDDDFFYSLSNEDKYELPLVQFKSKDIKIIDIDELNGHLDHEEQRKALSEYLYSNYSMIKDVDYHIFPSPSGRTKLLISANTRDIFPEQYQIDKCANWMFVNEEIYSYLKKDINYKHLHIEQQEDKLETPIKDAFEYIYDDDIELPKQLNFVLGRSKWKPTALKLLICMHNLIQKRGFDVVQTAIARKCNTGQKEVSKFISQLKKLGLIKCIDHTYIKGKKAKTYKALGILVNLIKSHEMKTGDRKPSITKILPGQSNQQIFAISCLFSGQLKQGNTEGFLKYLDDLPGFHDKPKSGCSRQEHATNCIKWWNRKELKYAS